MERRRFGNTDLMVSAIGLGCYGMSGAYGSAEWRPVDRLTLSGGLRLNAWVSIALFVLSTGFFVWWQFFHRGGDEPKRATRTLPAGPKMAIPRGRAR